MERKNQTIYICGQVTGLPVEETRQKFEAAAEYCRAVLGFKTAINPMNICSPVMAWPEAMKRCIGNLMMCHAIYMLPDWTKSRGATLERFIATNLSIEIIEGAAL